MSYSSLGVIRLVACLVNALMRAGRQRKVKTSAEEITNGSREISPYTGEPLSAGGSGDNAFEPCTTLIPLDETWVMWKVSGRVAIWTQVFISRLNLLLWFFRAGGVRPKGALE